MHPQCVSSETKQHLEPRRPALAPGNGIELLAQEQSFTWLPPPTTGRRQKGHPSPTLQATEQREAKTRGQGVPLSPPFQLSQELGVGSYGLGSRRRFTCAARC